MSSVGIRTLGDGLKMAAVMNTLFPSMTVENVLKSQVAELAKLQLSRMIENGPKNIYPQSTVVQRLLERRKAQVLVKLWKQERLGTPEEEVEEYGDSCTHTDAATQDVGWKQPLTGR